MPIHDLLIYELSSFDAASFRNVFSPNTAEAEAGGSAVNKTFSTSGTLSTVKAQIDDSNSSLNDDIALFTRQRLNAPLTINGKTYPAGTNIEMGFAANLHDPNGDLARVYSIKLVNSSLRINEIVGLAIADANNPAWQRQPIGDFGTLDVNIRPTTTYKVVSVNNGDAGATTTYTRFLMCFTAGTLIETDRGPVEAQDLQAGDLVLTRDHGLQPIRWIGTRHVSTAELEADPTLRPVRIAAGALGRNIPERDLIVSPQHRVLVRSKIAQKMFDTDEVLVAAKQLMLVEGVDIDSAAKDVTYVHFMFDAHQIVFSNGAETESLFTGPVALASVSDAAREEILTLFPQLRDHDYKPEGARLMPSGRMGRKLAIRHASNRKPLVM